MGEWRDNTASHIAFLKNEMRLRADQENRVEVAIIQILKDNEIIATRLDRPVNVNNGDRIVDVGIELKPLPTLVIKTANSCGEWINTDDYTHTFDRLELMYEVLDTIDKGCMD